jgi:D-alanyl-D-alanine carboxypeptidase/D-alanyl-D-alanine-endopeptidase (penicillin-binding protein 4)
VPLPTALTFNRNTYHGRHISNPEARAARALKKKLEARGVNVTGRAAMGPAPRGLDAVARLRSPRLATIARYMNRRSDNFFAEVLGKALGAAVFGRPGTIAKGAAAIRAWAALANVEVVARDSSGLSYENRISPRGMTRLLTTVSGESWARTLRRGLPTGDQGTLEDRLKGIPVRAKTGTLLNISALSGWVWLGRRDTWAAFSILSRGMPKATAARLEDRVVRIVNRYGR